MSKDKNKQELVSANIKITKGQVPLARELGITHANFRNKGLNKRLRKEQKELDKRQQRNTNKRKLLDNYLQAKKAIETETARHQQAEKEYDSVLEQVMSVPPEPGPLEDVGYFGANFKDMREGVERKLVAGSPFNPPADPAKTPEQAALRVMDILDMKRPLQLNASPSEDLGYFGDSPRETVEQAAKRVMGILGFDDQSEAASLENTYEACLDIKAERKASDSDNVVNFSTLSEDDPDYMDKRRKLIELHAKNRIAAGNTEGLYIKPVEETGIDPTLPFDDGTVDTNDDPKNFGVQSVDNDTEEVKRVTGKHSLASDLAFRETTKGFYDGCTEIDSEMDNLCEVIIGAGGFVDVRAPDGSAIIRDPENGWVNRLPTHMVNDTSINDSYPNIPQPLDWDGLKKKIAEQGGLSNFTIMAELPTNEPTGRGFPPIPGEPGCTEITRMYPGMDSLAGLNPFGGTCGGNRRQMYGNSEGQQPRALAKREFFDKHASEATPEDISQVFPHHPDHQLDPMLVEAAEMAAEALGLHDEGFTTKVLDDMIIMTPLQKPKDDSSDKE